MSDDLISAEQALLDPIEIDRLAVTSRAMGTVCDAKGWQTSTARHHRKVADTLEAQAAEIARLRAMVEASEMEKITQQAARDARDIFSDYRDARDAVDYMEQLIYAALATYQQKREAGDE